ncbi:MAG: hypothetical protein JXA14_14040 [Anaerolineae bacterium]|nr:hypothetical protein [Anaerolineae bacterium]
MNVNLSTVNLKRALCKSGCPICRLRQQAERRYLFTLLYENVNDGGTRQHLVHGMGLCPEHTWALQAVEQERWHDGLGVGIIFEDLAGRVSASLAEYLKRSPAQSGGRHTSLCRRLERLGRPGRWLACHLPWSSPGASLLAQLSPSECCRACDLVGRMEEAHLNWLVEGLAEGELRAPYAASAGLCLPHLRLALASASDEQAVHCLAEVAAAHLGLLMSDLGEYVRKHDWNNREEAKHPWEQAAWLRAVAFFAGEAPRAEGEDIDRMRRKAMTEFYRRGEIDTL